MITFSIALVVSCIHQLFAGKGTRRYIVGNWHSIAQ